MKQNLREKLRPIGQSKLFKKNIVQKFLIVIPVIIVVLVFTFYREADAYRAPEDLYTYIGEVKTDYPAGTKFQRTKEGTFLEKSGGQSISSRPLYMGSDDKIVLPAPYSWVTMNVGSAAMYRLESFSTVDISEGPIQLKDDKLTQKGVKGFLYDGKGTYIFLEPVNLEWGSESRRIPAMSFITIQYGGDMNLHVYGEDTASLISVGEEDVKAAFQDGGAVSLGTEKMWLPNGTWLLLLSEPELLPRMDEME